jgi:hypothetical protein
MADTTDTDYFTDTDQLDQLIKDAKSLDKKRLSTIADARRIVQDFSGRDGSSAWSSLDRAQVSARLLELLGPPEGDDSTTADSAGRALQQGSLNLCGPAALFNFVIKRHPVMFATYATQMFESRRSALGSLTVAPNDDIVDADYSALLPRMTSGVCPQADWMVLSALRNSTDAFWAGSFRGDPDQELSADTSAGELTDWLTQTGIYSSVNNDANWMQSKGIPHATNLSVAEGVDVAPMIHTNLIKAARNELKAKNWPLTDFPNHWVVLIAEVVTDDSRDGVFFNIWTWGGTQILEVPTQDFIQNYYGAVTATLGNS